MGPQYSGSEPRSITHPSYNLRQVTQPPWPLFSSSDSIGECSLTHGIIRRIQWDDVCCVNLLEQHVAHRRPSSNANSSALQVVQVSRCLSSCFSRLPLKFQTQSWQIRLFFFFFVFCNLGYVTCLTSFWSKFHHLQSWGRGCWLFNGLDKWFLAFLTGILLSGPHI